MDTPINIDKHEIKELSFAKKHIVYDGKLKYEFFETKKDGDKTKAFEQWETYGLGVGKRVEAGVSEEPQSFVNQKGENVNFTRRTILFFKGDEHGTPSVADLPQEKTEIAKALEEHVEKYHSTEPLDF